MSGYVPGIPDLLDIPSESQEQIKTNFTALNTVFDEDHVPFDAASDYGEHKKTTFNNVLGSAPNLASPKSSIFAMADSGGSSQLFFENFNVPGAANVLRQMTNLPITTIANTGSAGGNISYIDTPWGLRFMWGITNSFSGNANVDSPAGTTLLTFQLTANVASGSRNPINGGLISGSSVIVRTIDNVAVRYFMIGTY